MRVRVTPRRASSVASRLARAASVSRRIRPHRSISQLADRTVLKVVLSGSTNIGNLLFAGSRSVAAQAIADLRRGLRLRAGKDGGELVDARRRDPQVQVVGQRLSHQAVQIRVTICVPPRRVLRGAGKLFTEPVCRRNHDRRLDVIRALDAAGNSQRQQLTAAIRPRQRFFWLPSARIALDHRWARRRELVEDFRRLGFQRLPEHEHCLLRFPRTSGRRAIDVRHDA